MSLNYVKDILKKYTISPSKGLGQNFLIDKEAVKRVIKAAELNSEDIVLEIGPGLGVLTQELAKKVTNVIAVEKDLKMVEILKETLKDFHNIEIIQGDIRKIDLKNYHLPKNYKVVANLPFYLTAPIIRRFLELDEVSPQLMVLVIQKEVGQRICAKPPEMSILAVSVQFYAKPEIISFIPRTSFWPKPKVDAAVIKITNITKPSLTEDLFFKIVKAGFANPRKQLINNLSKKLLLNRTKVENWLLKNKIQPERRAETLKVEDWVKLTRSYL
ncbi:MAG: 16S rRNA (adenine(1518)-N(6)/adenine(1519)-N(6))-dimethyltransferase RsmA [bacterium]